MNALSISGGTIGSLPCHESTKRAIEKYVNQIRELEGENLLRVVLYGSQARGDFADDSDVDLFVLLEKGNPYDVSMKATDLAFDISCESDMQPYLSVLARTRSYLEEKYGGTLPLVPVIREIEEDGVVIYGS